MEKAGNTLFTKIKVMEEIDLLGKTMHITNKHYKMLLEDALAVRPKELQHFYHLKAQYEFKDDIPKDTLIVKTRDGIDKETQLEIKFGLMQFVSDQTITVSDRFELEEFFVGLLTPFNAYTYFVCMMVLLLSFFMMIVSFSQKMHDLEWEQGVLRAIGLTKV